MSEKLHFTVTRWIPAHIRWAEKERNKTEPKKEARQ